METLKNGGLLAFLNEVHDWIDGQPPRRPAQSIEVIIQGARYKPSCKLCGWSGHYCESLGQAQTACGNHRNERLCERYLP